MNFRANKYFFVVILLLLTLLPQRAESAREERINQIEVFVSAYCYRINNLRGPEILLLKRSPNRIIYPDMWECAGGSVQANESFEAAAKRQLREEAGITGGKWKMVECFEVEIEPGVIIPGVAFSCRADPDAHVELDPKEHVDYRWVTIHELEDFALDSQKMRKSLVRLLMLQDKLFD